MEKGLTQEQFAEETELLLLTSNNEMIPIEDVAGQMGVSEP